MFSVGRATSSLTQRPDRYGTGHVQLSSIDLSTVGDFDADRVLVGGSLKIRVTFKSRVNTRHLELFLWFVDELSCRSTYLSNRLTGTRVAATLGGGAATCRIPTVGLTPGNYTIDAAIAVGGEVADFIHGACSLSVDSGPFFATGRTPLREHGTHLTKHEWIGDDA